MLSGIPTLSQLLIVLTLAYHALIPVRYVPNARITSYVPELGGINCMEPCDRTAYLEPIEYGLTVACGPSMPYGTTVIIADIGVFKCLDRGGAITDDRIDIAITLEDHNASRYYYGYADVLWIPPSIPYIVPDSAVEEPFKLVEP